MKAVILAAGKSTRLRPLTDDVPKCLLAVGGRAILGMMLENLAASGVAECVIVTGYREPQIREYVAGHNPGIAVTFLSNERYAETNNIYSLWLTRKHLAGHSMLLLDSDIVFDGAVLTLLLRSGRENCLAIARGAPLGDEEVKVRTDSAATILEIGKEVSPEEAAGESIGIEKFGPAFVGRLFDVLERKIVQRNEVNHFYEAAFQEVIDAGFGVSAIDIGNLPCVEVDTPEDLEAARALIGTGARLSSDPHSR